MSPNVGNFVHDLVEMAKATERLPGLERELEELHKMAEDYAKQIQRLEMRLIDKANEIDTLHSTNRDLEVARDAAELRFLEANDRTERALEFVKAQFGAAGGLIQSLEPPKPEPVKEEPKAKPVQEQPVETKPDPVYPWMGQSEPDPIPTMAIAPVDTPQETATPTDQAASTGQSEPGKSDTPPAATSTDDPSQSAGSDHVEQPATASAKPGQSEPLPTQSAQSTDASVNAEGPATSVTGTTSSSEGQSEPLPTVASPIGELTAETPYVPEQAVADSQQQPEPKPLGRFHGKRYYDHPVWVSLQDWLAEGGTEADYQWRPDSLRHSSGF